MRYNRNEAGYSPEQRSSILTGEPRTDGSGLSTPLRKCKKCGKKFIDYRNNCQKCSGMTNFCDECIEKQKGESNGQGN